MRQIKFRGKSLRDGEWFYGNLFERDTKGNTHITTLERGCLVIDPDTVGQYTGLHDRKDREIYEGDVLFVEFDDRSGGNQLVGWNEKTASWGVMDAYSYHSYRQRKLRRYHNHILLAYLKEASICEVVGNIHDNPELMNVSGGED